MKKILLCSSILLFAACSGSDTDTSADADSAMDDAAVADAGMDDSAADTDMATAPTEAEMTAPGPNPTIYAGTYLIEYDNGWGPVEVTLMDDGTARTVGVGPGNGPDSPDSARVDKTGPFSQQDGNLCLDGDSDCWMKDRREESGAIILTRQGITATMTPAP